MDLPAGLQRRNPHNPQNSRLEQLASVVEPAMAPVAEPAAAHKALPAAAPMALLPVAPAGRKPALLQAFAAGAQMTVAAEDLDQM